MQRVDRSATDSETEISYVAARLRDRRGEIVAAVLSRIGAVSPPPDLVDEEYIRGLESAVAEAIEYGLGAVELGGGRSPSIPPALLIQARLAAMHRISLDSVLRRYIAGHALMTQFVVDEVRRDPANASGSALAVARLTASLDRIVDAVSEEHTRESRAQVNTTDQRQVDLAKRILGGELLFTDQFAYDFGGRHVGILAAGTGAAESTRALAKALDRRLLLVQPTETSAWAWLEVKGEFDWCELERAADRKSSPAVALAVGDVGEGIAGWRRTHQQARAASALAIRRPGTPVRYGPNNERIAALRDDLFKASLEEMYLKPLSRGGRDDTVLQDTLRCYMATGRNAASAASVLGVSRRTVTNRVLLAEELIGSTLIVCGGALEVALWLEEFERDPNSESGMALGPEI
jgi:hypothetical protein